MENPVINSLSQKISSLMQRQHTINYISLNYDLSLDKNRLISFKLEVMELRAYLELLEKEIDRVLLKKNIKLWQRKK